MEQDLWLTWLENIAQVSRKTGAGVPIPEHHFSTLYTKRLVNPPYTNATITPEGWKFLEDTKLAAENEKKSTSGKIRRSQALKKKRSKIYTV